MTVGAWNDGRVPGVGASHKKPPFRRRGVEGISPAPLSYRRQANPQLLMGNYR